MTPHFERQYRSPERNNPGYTPEYKELEASREAADALCQTNLAGHSEVIDAIKWLAAEVRVVRLERALER